MKADPCLYFPAFAGQPPYPARLIGPATMYGRPREGLVDLELIGGARDGARVKALEHDPAGMLANSWCRLAEYKGVVA